MAQTSRLVLEIDSRGAEQKAADTRKALEALEGAGLRVKPALDKAGAGMEDLGASSDKAKRSVHEQSIELERLLGSLDPVRRKQTELAKSQKELAAAFARGDLNQAGYTQFSGIIRDQITALNTSRTALTGVSTEMVKTGMSAKATAAAMRGVPAQITDIVVSLQGGQAPLTVLLQQGGQLKDMFGGIVPAAKALSSSILGMINPLTVGAAAAAALGVAYYQGSNEATAFSKALILSGNAAGASANQLAVMADRISQTAGSTSSAAAALTQLAGSSRIPLASFEAIATAALNMQKATGKAASSTIEDFEKIAKEPTKQLAALNEQYGFVTASVYEQVRALEQQGDRQSAATLATNAYAAAMDQKSKAIKANLGLIETGWENVTSAAKRGWDAMLDIGRESSLDQKMKNAQKSLDLLKEVGGTVSVPGLNRAFRGEDGKKQLQDIIDGYKSLNEQQVLSTKAEGDRNRIQREGLVAFEGHQKTVEDGYSKTQKLNKALEAEQQRITKARAAGYSITAEQEEAAYKTIRESSAYKEAAVKKEKAYTEDAGIKALDQARQRYAVLLQQNSLIDQQGAGAARIGTEAQALIKWEQQLADIKGKKTLTADQKALLASQDLISAQLKRNAALEREAELAKSIQLAQKDQVQLLTLTGQLRAANSLKSSIEDAAQLAEYERQGNVEAVKRLETMIKIRDINLKASQKPGTIEGVSEAPQVTGIDASVGGAYSEIQRLNEESTKVDAWRAMELEKQRAYLDLKAINEETYAERVNNINQQGRDNQAKIERAKNSAVLASSADFFGNMTALSESGNKELAAVGKAAAIAQATIQGYVAVQNALAVQPYPVGMALAISAGVAAAANVAAIAGVGFSGGGYTGPGGVNEYAGAVHKGEVVWSQKDIKRSGGVAAVEALRNGNVSALPSSASSGGSTAVASVSSAPPQIHIHVNGDGSGASVNSTAGYEQMGQAVLATVRSEMPKIARAVIQQEKGQNGLLDPSNRRNAA